MKILSFRLNPVPMVTLKDTALRTHRPMNRVAIPSPRISVQENSQMKFLWFMDYFKKNKPLERQKYVNCICFPDTYTCIFHWKQDFLKGFQVISFARFSDFEEIHIDYSRFFCNVRAEKSYSWLLILILRNRWLDKYLSMMPRDITELWTNQLSLLKIGKGFTLYQLFEKCWFLMKYMVIIK